jgi:putative zinc finger/helix-turn-helix YgiT family protein
MTANQCMACGEMAVQECVVPFTVKHGDQSRTIQDRQMVCEQCGNASYIGKQISEHEFAVAAAIREMDGLLSAQELFRIRAKYRLKQTDMEQMLSTGPKTWTRWERGKVPQNKAADKLIRLMAEDPDVARRLMEQAGIDNPEAAAAFAEMDRYAKDIARALLRIELQQLQGDVDGVADRVANKAFETVRNVRRQSATQVQAA